MLQWTIRCTFVNLLAYFNLTIHIDPQNLLWTVDKTINTRQRTGNPTIALKNNNDDDFTERGACTI